MKISVLILSLLLSAFFSGSETAFVSVSFIEAQVWLKRKMSGAKWIFYFISHPDRYLITILIGNNIALITFTSLTTYYLETYINHFLILIINSLFLLIIGEILPKTFFRELAHKIIRYLAVPLLFFRWFFYPLYLFLDFFISFSFKLFGQSKQNLSQYFTKKDLEILLREGEKGGVIDTRERKIMSRVFRLSNRKVREVIVPRTEIVTLSKNDSIEKAVEMFKISGFSRLPVIDQDLDNILGIVYAKDLLNEPKNLKEIIRDSFFIPQSILCSVLLKQMQSKFVTFAIVLDEYGGTAGLVTLEDIVEELFGEISDEFDDHLIRTKKLSKTELLASTRAEIHSVNEQMKWKLPHGNFETIGGMIMDHLGRIPQIDESFKIDKYSITVLRGDKHKLRFVKIERLAEPSNPDVASK
jgi:putative hemolysin